MVREEASLCSIDKKKRRQNYLEGGKGTECAGAGARGELPCAKLGHWLLLKAWTLQTPVMPKGRCTAFHCNQKENSVLKGIFFPREDAEFPPADSKKICILLFLPGDLIGWVNFVFQVRLGTLWSHRICGPASPGQAFFRGAIEGLQVLY